IRPPAVNRSAATVAHLRPTGPYRPSPARHTCRQTHQARGHETAIATDRAALLARPSRPDAFSLGLCTYYLPAVVADGRACSLGGCDPNAIVCPPRLGKYGATMALAKPTPRDILIERIEVGHKSVGMVALTVHEGHRELVTYGQSGSAGVAL